jgi:hypothetical protein
MIPTAGVRRSVRGQLERCCFPRRAARAMRSMGSLRMRCVSPRVGITLAEGREWSPEGERVPGSGHRCEEKRVWRVLSFD